MSVTFLSKKKKKKKKKVSTANQIPSTLTVNKMTSAKFLLSHTSVALNQGQGHPDYNQNVEFTSIGHHVKMNETGPLTTPKQPVSKPKSYYKSIKANDACVHGRYEIIVLHNVKVFAI